MAPEGFEPSTYRLRVCRSARLSYEAIYNFVLFSVFKGFDNLFKVVSIRF